MKKNAISRPPLKDAPLFSILLSIVIKQVHKCTSLCSGQEISKLFKVIKTSPRQKLFTHFHLQCFLSASATLLIMQNTKMKTLFLMHMFLWISVLPTENWKQRQNKLFHQWLPFGTACLLHVCSVQTQWGETKWIIWYTISYGNLELFKTGNITLTSKKKDVEISSKRKVRIIKVIFHPHAKHCRLDLKCSASVLSR